MNPVKMINIISSTSLHPRLCPRFMISCEAVAPSASSGRTKGSLRLKMGATCIPHPSKVSYGGEDAHFMSQVFGGALGVSDGVGGWQESGINPAEYSETFMIYAKKFLESEEAADTVSASDLEKASGEWMDPSAPVPSPASTFESVPRTAVEALREAHRLTKKPGSATACVVRMDPITGELDAANLGDSGFLVIRDGIVISKSNSQQHFFDCPYQFGAVPEFLPESDTADDAAVYRIKVLPGDVIVLGSDGLLDNVWPEEIAGMAPASADGVQRAADALAALASERGADPEFESPYSSEATKEGLDLPIWEKISKISFSGGKVELGKVKGGKMDDVTVVVAVVEAGVSSSLGEGGEQSNSTCPVVAVDY